VRRGEDEFRADDVASAKMPVRPTATQGNLGKAQLGFISDQSTA